MSGPVSQLFFRFALRTQCLLLTWRHNSCARQVLRLSPVEIHPLPTTTTHPSAPINRMDPLPRLPWPMLPHNTAGRFLDTVQHLSHPESPRTSLRVRCRRGWAGRRGVMWPQREQQRTLGALQPSGAVPLWSSGYRTTATVPRSIVGAGAAVWPFWISLTADKPFSY